MADINQDGEVPKVGTGSGSSMNPEIARGLQKGKLPADTGPKEDLSSILRSEAELLGLKEPKTEKEIRSLERKILERAGITFTGDYPDPLTSDQALALDRTRGGHQIYQDLRDREFAQAHASGNRPWMQNIFDRNIGEA